MFQAMTLVVYYLYPGRARSSTRVFKLLIRSNEPLGSDFRKREKKEGKAGKKVKEREKNERNFTVYCESDGNRT